MNWFDIFSACFAVVLVVVTTWAAVFPSARVRRAAARDAAVPGSAGAVRSRHLVTAGIAAVGTAMGVSMVAGPFGVSAFGVIRLLYFACVIAIPAAAAFVLATRLGRTDGITRPAAALAALALLGAPVGVWTSFVEPYRLRLETATVDVGPGDATAAARRTARAGRDDVRVGVLADLQCNRIGEHERRAIDMLLAQKPDVILIPGDLMHASPGEFAEHGSALGELLSRLDAPGGVFFVMGDVDRNRTLEILRGTKVRPLLDEVARIRVRDRDVTIGGVSWHGEAVVRELECAAGDDDVRILLVHRPDLVLRLSLQSRIDLTVAGHTHGGQVVIPGFGPPMTLSRVPRRVAAGGLHELGGNRIYVSRGAGMERLQAPAMRLFCPPEVSVLTLSGTAPRQE